MDKQHETGNTAIEDLRARLETQFERQRMGLEARLEQESLDRREQRIEMEARLELQEMERDQQRIELETRLEQQRLETATQGEQQRIEIEALRAAIVTSQKRSSIQRLRSVFSTRTWQLRLRLLMPVLALVLTLAPGATTTLAATLNAWTTVASMPTARHYLAAVTGSDGRVYAIGGNNGSTVVNTVEAYTPATNSWATVTSMSTARNALAAAIGLDGRIYAIGGFNGTDLNTVEAYTLATNSWATVASMPTARNALAAVTGSDGRIYAIGGQKTGGATLTTVEAYTPSTNTWSTVAPMPTARSYLAAATGSDGRIYAIGGYNGGSLSTVEAYTPSTNTWSTLPSMSTARNALAAATGADGRIYAIGGNNGSPLSTAEAYNPSTNSWTTVASMSTARWGLAAAADSGGSIYAMGGANGGPSFTTVEAYTPPPGQVSIGAPGLEGLLFRATPLTSTVNAGVYGSGSNGGSLGGIGVQGVSDTGFGGEFSSISGAPLHLVPSSSTGPPTTGTHAIGEIYVDSAGRIHHSVTAGTPGTWVPLNAVIPINPVRVLDTRSATHVGTWTGPFASGSTLSFPIAGQTFATSSGSFTFPSNTIGVVGNLVAVTPTGAGYLVAYSQGSTLPTASSVNFVPPGTAADSYYAIGNNVTVALSGSGQMSIYAGLVAGANVQIVLDISGYIV